MQIFNKVNTRILALSIRQPQIGTCCYTLRCHSGLWFYYNLCGSEKTAQKDLLDIVLSHIVILEDILQVPLVSFRGICGEDV